VRERFLAKRARTERCGRNGMVIPIVVFLARRPRWRLASSRTGRGAVRVLEVPVRVRRAEC